MDYSLDQFNSLISEIESQGGALLPERCEGNPIVYTIPASERTLKAISCGCANNTMMVAPYSPAGTDKQTKKMLSRGAGFVRACMVCDAVGAWPRFQPEEEEK